jgi:hypothetical protein
MRSLNPPKISANFKKVIEFSPYGNIFSQEVDNNPTSV